MSKLMKKIDAGDVIGVISLAALIVVLIITANDAAPPSFSAYCERQLGGYVDRNGACHHGSATIREPNP